MMDASAPAIPDTLIDIRGLITNSLVEWEGRVVAVVFAAGCNWRCPYCHGWRFVSEPDSLQQIPVSSVFDLLEKQKGWIDGIALTGGEITLQPGLFDFVNELKRTGIAVKLETNGTRPDVIQKLLDADLLDCLALDYKAPLDERLATVSQVDDTRTALEAVQRSFTIAAESGIEREYHTTLCPRYIDSDTLDAMGQALEPDGLWILQRYETDDILNPDEAGSETFDSDELEALEQVARRHHEQVLLRKGSVQ